MDLGPTFGQNCNAAIPVRTENLNPDVMVMKSAKDRPWAYDSSSPNGPSDRRIFVR
jgi:hypothetical protein